MSVTVSTALLDQPDAILGRISTFLEIDGVGSFRVTCQRVRKIIDNTDPVFHVRSILNKKDITEIERINKLVADLQLLQRTKSLIATEIIQRVHEWLIVKRHLTPKNFTRLEGKNRQFLLESVDFWSAVFYWHNKTMLKIPESMKQIKGYLNRADCGPNLEKVPIGMRTYEICLVALGGLLGHEFELQYVPKHMRTKEIYRVTDQAIKNRDLQTRRMIDRVMSGLSFGY